MAAVISFTPAQAWLVASLAGTHNVSLTNYDNTSYPSIAQTSKGTEINGSFVEFSSGALTITDTGISDGEAYIYVYISGGTTVLAEATNTAPTYDVTKSGWYDAGGTKRCVAAMTKSGASYSEKRLVTNRETDLDNYITGTDDLAIGNDLTVNGTAEIEDVVYAKNGVSITSGDLYLADDGAIDGDLSVGGSLSGNGGTCAAFTKSTTRDRLDFPLGTIVFASATADRNQAVTLYLSLTDGYSDNISGTPLTGTWLARGADADGMILAQRVL